MLLDEEMFDIIAKNLKFDELTSNAFKDIHQTNVYELIIIKILNYYAKTHTQKDIFELELLMKNIKIFGRVGDQEKLIRLMQETFLSNPELIDDISKTKSKINADIVFDYLEKADNQGQIEMFTHLIRKQREIKEQGLALKKLQRNSK